MKITKLDSGAEALEGTPEELAAYERARHPAIRFDYGVNTAVCVCPKLEPGQPVIYWGGVCPLHHMSYAPAFPQITAAAGRPPTTMTHAYPAFESAEIGVPGNTARPVMWCRCGVFALPYPSRTWNSVDGTCHTPEVCTATGMQPAAGS